MTSASGTMCALKPRSRTRCSSSSPAANAVSDLQGNYVLPGIRYGTSTTFKVTPTVGGHQFTPAFKTITLSTGNPVQNEVGFIDITSFTASGHVSYANT